jgi:hypothetical protein
MKPFYTKQGKYADGRDRIVIIDRENNLTLALPKPEIYLENNKKSNHNKICESRRRKE